MRSGRHGNLGGITPIPGSFAQQTGLIPPNAGEMHCPHRQNCGILNRAGPRGQRAASLEEATSMQRSSWVLSAALVLLAILRPAAGDVFLLRSGGRIEGDLVNADENPRTSYVISLPNGGQVTLDAAVVEKVQPVKPELAEYEKVRRKYPDTVEGQLQMADWCHEHGLDAQRKTHLERVIQIDPDQAEARRTAGIPQGQRPVDDARRRDGRQGLRQVQRPLDAPAGGGTPGQPRQATQGRKRVDQEDLHAGGRGSRANRPNKARRTSARSTTPWPSSDWRKG